MQFRDPELQRAVERISAAPAEVSSERRPVFDLLDVLGWFRVVDGEPWPPSRPWHPHTPRVREIVERLISPELRPALRSWYRHCGENMNPSAVEFREVLNELVGEKL